MAAFRSCFWCLRLRTGCILIALLDMVLQLFLNLAAEWPTKPEFIGVNLAALAIVGLLIYGIVRENRKCLWLWMIVNNLVIALLTIVVVFCALGMIQLSQPYKTESDNELVFRALMGIYFIICGLVVLAISIAKGLFSYIVHSYICELRKNEEEKVILRKETLVSV